MSMEDRVIGAATIYWLAAHQRRLGKWWKLKWWRKRWGQGSAGFSFPADPWVREKELEVEVKNNFLREEKEGGGRYESKNPKVSHFFSHPCCSCSHVFADCMFSLTLALILLGKRLFLGEASAAPALTFLLTACFSHLCCSCSHVFADGTFSLTRAALNKRGPHCIALLDRRNEYMRGLKSAFLE